MNALGKLSSAINHGGVPKDVKELIGLYKTAIGINVRRGNSMTEFLPPNREISWYPERLFWLQSAKDRVNFYNQT